MQTSKGKPRVQTPSRFKTLSDFLEKQEELCTVAELCAIGPWKPSQIRYWLYESESNGFEAALIRPNARRLYIHSGRFKKWLEDRTAFVRQERAMPLVG